MPVKTEVRSTPRINVPDVAAFTSEARLDYEPRCYGIANIEGAKLCRQSASAGGHSRSGRALTNDRSTALPPFLAQSLLNETRE